MGDENARAGSVTQSPRAWAAQVLIQEAGCLLPLVSSFYSCPATSQLRTTEVHFARICYQYLIKSNWGTEKERGRKCSQNNK